MNRTGQPFSYANDDPANMKDPSGESGNPVDVICSGGARLPAGESEAKACGQAQSEAKKVTSSECHNDGGCGNDSCGTWGFECWYPALPLAALVCVAGGCETLATSAVCSSTVISAVLTLGALGSGPANTVIENPQVPDLPTAPSLFIEIPFPPEQSSGQNP